MTIARPIVPPIIAPVRGPVAGGALPWEAGGGAAPDLAARILAKATPAGWSTYFVGLSRGEADFSLVSGAVATWLDRSGRGNNATQGTGTARPTYSATAINSKPGMTLDGGDHLATGAIDTGSDVAYALIEVFSDSDTAGRCPAAFGDHSADRQFGVYTNLGSAGTLGVYGDATAGAGVTSSEARSAASFAMSTPAVVTATWDTTLGTNETEIRHASTNVTNSRPTNGNNTAGVGSQSLTVGGRIADGSPSLQITGAIGALVLLGRTSTISAAALTAIADIEALLAADKGL